MAIIRIIANDIELDFVRESLKIKRENNAFTESLKISHTVHPFLLIENQKTIDVLGPRDMASINRPKTVQVLVFEMGERYFGELQQLSYLKGYRKCNLKFGTELLNILNKKLPEFMPILSVSQVGTEGAPGQFPPYVKESQQLINGYQGWGNYPSFFQQFNFPQAKWQFPRMRFRNYFGEDLEPDDPWILYQNHWNQRDTETNAFVENSYIYPDPNNVEVFNRNVASPQVFLLSPLFYAMRSIGWKLRGSFVNDAFIRRILMLSHEHNMTRVLLLTNVEEVTWPGNWLTTTVFPFQTAWFKRQEFTIPESSNYTLQYRFVLPAIPNPSLGLKVRMRLVGTIQIGPATATWLDEIVFSFDDYQPNQVVEGDFRFDAPAGGNLRISYLHRNQLMPLEFDVKWFKTDSSREWNQMHPTIELGRFVPNWTLTDFLNQLKNRFNLEITPDDFTKELRIDFVENLVKSEAKEVALKSLALNTYEATEFDAFLFSNAAEDDDALYVSREGQELNPLVLSSFTNKVISKFKFVDFNGDTAELSEELEDREGVGLMIYDPLFLPNIRPAYLGKTLRWEGEGGLYDTFWKVTVKVRINSSGVQLQGPFTETEISKISRVKKIVIDHQAYHVLSMEYTDTRQENYLVNLKLESINI
jgi:hypothetical protein